MASLKPVDYSTLRTNQATIILLLVAAFVLDLPWLVGVVAVFMLMGSLLLRRPGFYWIYTRLLRPLKIARPDILMDHPEPHLFAQGLGGVFVLGSVTALLVGAAGLGWVLAWVVIGLAALNLLGGFCMGCFMYYWMNRLRVPGFNQAPPQGTTPGFKPKTLSAQEAGHVRK
jgi:hypothetical protein